MLAQIPLFPEQASTGAEAVDRLFFFILGVAGFFTVLIAWLVIRFSVIYRQRRPDERPPRIEGSLKLELFWTAVPLAIALFIFVWGVEVYFHLAQPPQDAMEIYVVGKQWMWKMQHPDGQREINELHVPVGQPVKLTMISEDVVHSFFIPAFRTKADVLPGRYTHTWFHATKTGRYHIFCAQYCGTNHAGMVGSIVVLEPAEYQTWLRSHAEGSMALEGRKLFLHYQCISCHANDAMARGPSLEDLYQREVTLRDGRRVLADETYLRKSIVNPDADVVAGFEPIMPSFQGQISEEELLKLVAFLKTLRHGQTPPRVDSAAPPEKRPPWFDMPWRLP
jgi:cytochrome c oxidase subunit 2